MHRRLLFILVLAFLILAPCHSARAGEGVTVLSPDVEYDFGGKAYFRARFESSQPIERVELVLTAPGVSTFVGSVSTSPSNELRFVYDLEERPLRLFSTVSYYYRFQTEGGEELKSETFSFPYLDNRFQWQSLERGKFVVLWYEADVTFARDVLDAAEEGREQVLALLQRPKNNRQISIYAYAAEGDLQSTLAKTDASWVGGHADPELGSVVVALPPGADRALQVQRQIPHEITHVMLYRFMGDGYQYLPRWFNEGVASQMELFPNPEYEVILEKAHREGELIPLGQICHSLPVDQELVLLAYAESSSVLSYIMQEYGLTGVRAMISAYDQGVSCSRGVEIALDRDLQTLEREWKRATFGGGFLSTTWGYILIAVVLGLVLAVIFGIVVRPLTSEMQETGGGQYHDK